MSGWPRASTLLSCALASLLLACADPSRVRSVVVPPDPPPLPARKPDFAGRSFSDGQAAPNATSVVVQSQTLARPPVYSVQPGDTVFGISRLLEVPLRALIDENDLEPPYTLAIGSTIQVPTQRVHVVQPGNTVYGISRAYGVDMSELMRANAIAPPYRIAVGQRLLLPDPSGEQSAAAVESEVVTSPLPTLPPPQAPQAEPERASAPPSPPPIIPPRDPEMPFPQPRPSSAPSVAQAPQLPARAEPRISTGTEVRAQPGTKQSAAIPQPPDLAGGKFLWPVRGTVAARFGPQGDGRHNDGVNILAARGTPVLAAQNGVVAYVGNELRGFGNLLLLKHADGWVTAYAHLDRVTVARGATVRRGDSIGLVGSSGNVAVPQLHFEIRKGSRAVDPLGQLGAQRAALDQ